MGLIVQKFGGTSVGTLERIEAVASQIAASAAQGHQLVVVSSAMGGQTDQLIEMAKAAAGGKPPPREYSMLVATGEQVAVALLSMALAAKGLRAKSYTGWQAGINTCQSAKNARITSIDTTRLLQDVAAGIIPVVAGFQGVDQDNEITTLGRGGSDTTAVALAAALQAQECQIYTDVDGVYTADPRVVPQAKRLSEITFEEMMELASLGAKVLQPRAVEFAGKYRVKLRVLSSFVAGSGTLISYEEKKMEDALVAGIAYNRSEAKLTLVGIPDQPGIASRILEPISDAGIGIDMVIQNIAENGLADFTFTLHRDDYHTALEILEKTAVSLNARQLLGDMAIVKISLVGVGMRSHAGVATKMFSVLGSEGINIQMISTSEIKVSVVVAEKYLELSVRALHTAFGLDDKPQEETDPY